MFRFRLNADASAVSELSYDESLLMKETFVGIQYQNV